LAHLVEQSVAEFASLLVVLRLHRADDRGGLLVRLDAVEHRLEHAVDVLGDRALLRACRRLLLLAERLERVANLLGRRRDLLELARGQLAVLADRRVPDELANLLRVLGRDLRDELDEHAADERPRLLEGRERLLLGPRGEAARPEVVVLVEALLAPLGEEVAAALEALLERGELLV